MRRMPGGSLPPHLHPPHDDDVDDDLDSEQRPRRRRRAAHLQEGGELPEGQPFDPVARPLGMISNTWVPTDEPVILKDEPRLIEAVEGERAGPSLTVWIILIVFIVVVLLAVISYRNAPP
jgi:hypothetical protein